jgi:hypothetical protein
MNRSMIVFEIIVPPVITLFCNQFRICHIYYLIIFMDTNHNLPQVNWKCVALIEIGQNVTTLFVTICDY